MEVNIKKQVTVQAKTIKLFMKVCDQFKANLMDQDGDELKDYEGYVPDFMPGDHYGDYLILDIDIDSGQILNWKKPTSEQIETFINGEQEEDY